MSGERRVAAAALLLSVFLAGGLGGVVVARLLQPDPRDRWEGRPPLPGDPSSMPLRDGRRGPGYWPRGFSPMMLNERLSRALDLTDEQDARIREILEARRANSARVLEEIQPRLQAELDSIRIEIRAILTPAQAERFDEFMRREEEMFTRRMPRPDSVGPPHR